MTIFDARGGCSLHKDDLFYDTNIWIFLYGSPPARGSSKSFERSMHTYSAFHAGALKNGNKIYTSEKVLSEFFNRMVKAEYDIMFGPDKWHSFKTNRQSDEFRQIMDDITDKCQDICDSSEYIECSFDKDAMMENIVSASSGKIDLTDLAILQRCKDHNLKLVTHDGDFLESGIDIVTANPATLGRLRH